MVANQGRGTVMKRILLISATLCGLCFAALAEEPYKIVPCDEIPSDFFMGFNNPQMGLRIIDVGEVKKAAGRNLCTVTLDTTMGRVQMGFTTILSISGDDTIIKRVSIKVLSY